ncbi:hypothetical protein AKO1_002629 [Acrasis kona]|uniref:Uncharacterized protein n=1 Tax=Acrasis kona TaxID=1008807 RepID=A0AAW2ZQH3_9EUKA
MNDFPQLSQECLLLCPPPPAQLDQQEPTVHEVATAIEYGHKIKSLRLTSKAVTDEDVVHVEIWSKNSLTKFVRNLPESPGGIGGGLGGPESPGGGGPPESPEGGPAPPAPPAPQEPQGPPDWFIQFNNNFNNNFNNFNNNLNNLNNNLNNLNNNFNNLNNKLVALNNNQNVMTRLLNNLQDSLRAVHQNSFARDQNRFAVNLDDDLVPLHNDNNAAPPNFPGTRGDLLGLSANRCNTLLVFYGQPRGVGAVACRHMLARFLGLP